MGKQRTGVTTASESWEKVGRTMTFLYIYV